MRTSRVLGVDHPAVRHRWGHAVVAAIVALAGIAATLVLASHERHSVSLATTRTFETSAGNVGQQTRLQLSRYVDLLGSLQALQRANRSLTDASFAHDLAEQVLARDHAGHQAIVIKLRAVGAPVPAMDGAHIEPHARTAGELGLAQGNSKALLEAIRQATDTALPTLTRPLPVSDEPNAPRNLVMWAPLFHGEAPQSTAARRRDVVGWAGVVFRADQFFHQALVRSSAGVGTEVYDGAPRQENLIAVRPHTFVPGGEVERLNAVAAPGRLWILRMQPLTPSGAGATERVILVAGLLLSLLVALFIGGLGAAKDRALRLVGETTGDLRRSEERFRSLATASPLGVFSLSADGHCEYANDRLCDLAGRTLEELQGTGLSGVYHPDDRVALRKAVTGDNSRSSALRLRLMLPDGTLRWVKTHAAPLRDDDGMLSGWVGTVEDVTTEVQAQIAAQQLSVELSHQARHDHLTGLPNRTFFTEQITELIDDPDSQGVSVLFFDIDRFKVVNDSLGHGAGDRLLTAFSQRLRLAIRPGDLVARFGGDEFVVGLVGTANPDLATAEAQRLITALNRTVEVDGHEVLVSVSMGVAVSIDGADAETLLTHADTAMYRAKARGKARYELFRAAAPSASGESTLELERQLRHAIDHDELRLFYQPIVAVASQEIAGVEALVRWDHPERGFLPPSEFVPLAEESGLAVPLGAWVLHEACAQLERWRPLLAGRPDFSMSVNVSTRQLADPLFPTLVATVLHDHDVDPTRICLEITETALLQDLETADEALRKLRELGVRIAVDDFGTGYSSLSHLKLLPIDVVKIDRSFVNDLGVDADNTAIVGAVIRLAGALGLTSVAEGVEERDQLNWLSSMGCDFAQGYFIAMPEPAEVVGLLMTASGVDGTGEGAETGALRPIIPSAG